MAFEDFEGLIPRFKKIMGAILVLSPLGNFLMSAAITRPQIWWQPPALLDYVSSVTTLSWLLWGAAFGSGLMLLTRGASNLVFAIALLGINIFYGLISFSRNASILGWQQPSLQMAMNLFFLGVMVWIESKSTPKKMKVPAEPPDSNKDTVANPQPSPLSTPLEFSLDLKKRVHIKIPHVNALAKVVQVKHTGLVVQMLSPEIPYGITHQTLELSLPGSLFFRLQATHFYQNFCEFRFLNVTHEDLLKFKSWAESPAPPTQKSLAS